MESFDRADIRKYIEENIKTFHEARIAKIRALSLRTLLKKKNPYLFKAKDIQNADQLIHSILGAFLSSSEETMLGGFLEELAIFINGKVYCGVKAGIPGIDLDFIKDGTRYLVSIKSGPAWGNAQAVEKMVQNFNTAKRTLRTSGGYKGNIEFVNGCCYGIDNKSFKKKGYYKYCGQMFWFFISGIEDLYEEIIVPLDHNVKLWNEQIEKEYRTTSVRLANELLAAGLTMEDGSINWRKFVQTTSKMEVRS